MEGQGTTVNCMFINWSAPKLTVLLWPDGQGTISGVLFSTHEHLQEMQRAPHVCEESLARAYSSLPKAWVDGITDQLKVGL